MVIWLIGMSGAGKTAVGRALYARLKPVVRNLVFLDGDLLREVWGDELGHSVAARRINADRIGALCRMLDQQDIHVICAVLSIFPAAQAWNRANYRQYFEVYLRVSEEELHRRDVRGLYRQALAGTRENVVGVDIPFPEPPSPDLVVDNEGGITVEAAVGAILDSLGRLQGAPVTTAS
jgi:adenylylsulfate kinase